MCGRAHYNLEIHVWIVFGNHNPGPIVFSQKTNLVEKAFELESSIAFRLDRKLIAWNVWMILRFCPPRFRNSIKIVPWIVSCDVKLGLGLHGPNVLPAVQARKRGNKMGEGERFIFHVQKWINQDFRTIYLFMYVCCSLFFCVFEMIIQENREEK